MASEDPITQWIEQLRAGDRDAAAHMLWNQYFEKLVHFARKKLGDYPRRVEDEEDVALSAFKSICRAVKEGRFPDLDDRDGLWRILLSITARKVVNRIRHYERQKRKVAGETAIGGLGSDFEERGIGQVLGVAPTPEFTAEAIEECRRLLDLLKDPRLRSLAMAKMEGCTNEVIAGRFDCSVRTVERQLQLIRKTWKRETA
jgi:RNA polymerase sigma factor (sigma-70 family)